MEALAWIAIGFLAATLLGALFYLGNRIDSRLEGLAERANNIDARFDGLDLRMDSLTARVRDQGRELGSQIYALGTKLDEHLRRHAG